jgi:hypothetical protein
MLSATITYQVLLQERPQTINKVKAVLESIPDTRTMVGIDGVAIRKANGGHRKIVLAIFI